jgi:serine/threonine protein kinase
MNNQIGGKLLSEGAYGCVFYPSIFKNSKRKYVSKIQKDNFSGKNEIKIGDKIKDHPYFLNHFVPVVNSTPINVSSIKDEDTNNCTIIKRYKDSNFLNMKIFYINGKNFLDFIISNKSSDFNFVNLLIDSYNHLLNSLQMLIDMEIVHYDLKGNNIMVNYSNNLPLILDFGLSIKVDEIKKDMLDKFFYVYAPEYSPWALEIHYLSFLLKVNNNPSLKDLEYMVENYVDNATNPIGILFPESFVKTFKKNCLNQLIKYKNMGTSDSIVYILKFWNTWDNFSLSIIFLNIFYYIYGKKNIPKQEFIKIILEILLMNVHPNPEMRLTVEKTSLLFNEKLLNFVQNLDNFKFISNLNKDFVKNKEEFKKRKKIHQTLMNTMTKKNKRKY